MLLSKDTSIEEDREFQLRRFRSPQRKHEVFPSGGVVSGLPQLLSILKLPQEEYKMMGQIKNLPSEYDELRKYHRSFPFYIRTPHGVEIWVVSVPDRERHWIIGTWLGYPQCCVIEHISDCKQGAKAIREGKPTPTSLKSTQMKAVETREHIGLIPCNKCLVTTTSELVETVNEHRCCPVPAPNYSPGVDSWIQAVIAYHRGRLTPWTVHPVDFDLSRSPTTY